jgi:hypothetical protein
MACIIACIAHMSAAFKSKYAPKSRLTNPLIDPSACLPNDVHFEKEGMKAGEDYAVVLVSE